MGDDLGDEWEAESLGSGNGDISAAAAVVPKAMKKARSNKSTTTKTAKTNNAAAKSGVEEGAKVAIGNGGALASRKRGRSQLSPEGFGDSDDQGFSSDDEGGSGNSGDDDEEEEEDEETRMKAAEEEEAKIRRAEKKKLKLKALKAKMKEKKRQRTEEDDRRGNEAAAEGMATDGAIGDKSRTRDAVVTAGSDEAAEMLWAAFCKKRGDMVTPLELDSPWITTRSMACVEGFGAHTAIKLVGFIKASLPDWKKRIQNRDNSNAPRGSPSVLIVCAGARRCVEVMKHLTAFRCQVLKLFAKHLKLEEQKVMLRKGCFPLAVGTPGRMHALAAAGSLRLDSSALIVLDMEKNIKGRNVLDMDGVANDTMALLADYVRPSLTSSSSTSSLPEPDAASSAKGSKKNKKRKKNGGGGKGKGAEGQLRIALY